MTRLPPALAASATARILELLPPPPATVLELASGGIHAVPLRLAGYEVTVVDPVEGERARARAGDPVHHEAPRRRYQALIAPEGLDASGIDAEARLTVRGDGTVTLG